MSVRACYDVGSSKEAVNEPQAHEPHVSTVLRHRNPIIAHMCHESESAARQASSDKGTEAFDNVRFGENNSKRQE